MIGKSKSSRFALKVMGVEEMRWLLQGTGWIVAVSHGLNLLPRPVAGWQARDLLRGPETLHNSGHPKGSGKLQLPPQPPPPPPTPAEQKIDQEGALKCSMMTVIFRPPRNISAGYECRSLSHRTFLHSR